MILKQIFQKKPPSPTANTNQNRNSARGVLK